MMERNFMASNRQPSSSKASLLEPSRTLGIIGMGVMGQAILRGLLRAGAIAPAQAWGTSRSAETCRSVGAALQVAVTPNMASHLATTGVVVLCVKPTQVAAAIAALRASATLRPDTLLISIVAGLTLRELEAHLGTENPWVRAMPNTPCIVGEGMTAVAGGERAGSGHVGTARQIFECVGECVETEERHFDAITALSGSGPAYQFLIMEAMADAGVRVGLPRDLALTLVAQTALGAARMVQTSGRHPAALRDDVTTPAGCTIGGLLMLEDGKIRSVLARAIEEATRIVATLAPKTPAGRGTDS
jgi:pyrroline-5-carboxylate reductase